MLDLVQSTHGHMSLPSIHKFFSVACILLDVLFMDLWELWLELRDAFLEARDRRAQEREAELQKQQAEAADIAAAELEAALAAERDDDDGKDGEFTDYNSYPWSTHVDEESGYKYVDTV